MIDNASGHPLIQLEPRERRHHISRGRSVLATARDGTVHPADDHEGLWVQETRVLSKYEWRAEDQAPTLSALSAIEQHHDLAYYVFAPPECRKSATPGCDPAQNSIELRIERTVGEGMLEVVTLTNHTQLTSSFNLDLHVDADFADPSEAGGKRKQHGTLTRKWSALEAGHSLRFNYKAKHAYRHQNESGTAFLHRGIRLELRNDQHAPEYRNKRIRFRVKLAPRATWNATLTWIAQIDDVDLPSPTDSSPIQEQKRKSFLDACTRYDSPQAHSLTSTVLRTLHQSVSDLASLRLYDLDSEDSQGERWIPAAGIPAYIGLFSRDVLFTSREAASVHTALMRGALAEVATHIGAEFNDWRDEQPGRMIHEMHGNPTAILNYNPHARYYGEATSSIFYPSVVADLWRWTGSKELIAPFIKPALLGLAWADKYSRDDSGFYKYQTRSKKGEKNQAWKDSDDAVVYPDGSQVGDPLGTCEMQGYVYASKLRLAEVLWHVGDRENAQRLRADADELKKRFNDFFWMKEEGYIAFGIDSHNRPIRSIASDPGHCLLHGIIDAAHQRATARRMLAPDMFSGWGIRTLSADHPAYNPFSYHRGTIWPVENGEFVSALGRCGMHDEMNLLAKALFEAAALFKYYRLPEVYSGHPRDAEHPFPGLYPRSNSPQAWSASAPLLMVQSMLGIEPYAPMQILLTDPHLPDWLPEITISNLRVGAATVSLRFWRELSGHTDFEILDLQGALHVIRHADPWSLISGSGPQVQENLSSLRPID